MARNELYSIPAQQPMRIRPGLISRTRLTMAVFISRPHQAGSRNPQNDLVETTSPGYLPPSALSGRIETTSLGRPHTPELAKALTQSSPVSHRPIKDEFKLTLKEELSPSYRAAATWCPTTRRPLHSLPSLTQSLKWDLSLQ